MSKFPMITALAVAVGIGTLTVPDPAQADFNLRIGGPNVHFSITRAPRYHTYPYYYYAPQPRRVYTAPPCGRWNSGCTVTRRHRTYDEPGWWSGDGRWHPPRHWVRED